jgi:plastocyanin
MCPERLPESGDERRNIVERNDIRVSCGRIGAALTAVALVAAIGCAGGKAKMVTDCSKPQTQTIKLGLVNGQAVIVSGCDPALVSVAAGDTIQWIGENGALIKIQFQSYSGQQTPFAQAATNCNGTTYSCSSGPINSGATQNFTYKYWFWVGNVQSADPGVIVKP